MKKPTDDLYSEMLGCESIDSFFDNNREEILFNGLQELLAYHISTKKLKKGEVFERAMIDKHYGYQILDGKRNPTRDKQIQLCFGLRLGLDEAQRLLRVGGCRELYVRDPRDAIVMFALRDGMPLYEANIELHDRGLQIFGEQT